MTRAGTCLLLAAILLCPIKSPANADDTDASWRHLAAPSLGASLELPRSWALRHRRDLGPRKSYRGISAREADGRCWLVAVRLPAGNPARNLEEAMELAKECFLEGCDLVDIKDRRHNAMTGITCRGHGPVDGRDARFMLVVARNPLGGGYIAVYVAGERDLFSDFEALSRRIIDSLAPLA